MKTNVNMVRKIGSFEIKQRTKDGMFNATELLKQWNKENNQTKKLDHYFENKATNEFIKEIESELDLDIRNSVYVKSRASRGENAGTWMHPYLFIDFAMWINPKFKYHVIKFVHDQLIEFRHMAGDQYKLLHKSGSRFTNYDFIKVAKALNYIVFNKHESGILRQEATEEQLKELSDLQKKLSFAIDMGYITTYDGLIVEMRRMWHIKYDKNRIT